MTTPTAPSPMADLVTRQNAQREAADLKAALLLEQHHQYFDLDADSSCRPKGFVCPACPPNDTPGGAA